MEMEQQLVGEREEEVIGSINCGFDKQDDGNRPEDKSDSKLDARPSTSAEVGISLPLVDGVIYNYKYVSKVKDLPFGDMISSSSKRNLRLPKIYLTGRPFEISFLLDTEYISERDLWVDNLGSWAGTLRRPTCKSIRINALGVPDTKNPYYVVRKKYGSHPHSDPPLGLMKCLCYLTRDGRATGNALLSYKCLENCNLRPRPHGNTRHNQSPYIRTYPSTLLKIKERLGLQSPAAIWNELSVDTTGNMDAQAALRDRKQVYNARLPRKKSPDPQMQDEVSHLKARIAGLEEQNSKLIFTNASLMELVNDLRKAKQELETENHRIKQNNNQELRNGVLPSHLRIISYSDTHNDKTRGDVYKTVGETSVMVREQCIENCQVQGIPSTNQSTCFATVPGQSY